MTEFKSGHQHLRDDEIDVIVHVGLEGGDQADPAGRCSECESKIADRRRYISLARLMTRDSRAPLGTPAIQAVRTIRRKSYHRRALREIVTLLVPSSSKGQV